MGPDGPSRHAAFFSCRGNRQLRRRRERSRYVARSVVTRTIQDLEEWTARGVLERTMHAMQLTEACDRFYTYCRRVLQDTEQTLLAMRRAPAELAGRITISPPVSLTLLLERRARRPGPRTQAARVRNQGC